MISIRGSLVGVGASVVAALGTRWALNRFGGPGHAGKGPDPTDWRLVTVNRPPGELTAPWPAPLTGWEPPLRIETRPAPGDRGTELAARLTDASTTPPPGLDGDTPVQMLRSALRRAKQLLETGEILRSDRAFGTSSPTPLNKPLRAVTERAGGVGRR
jgi:hypothetical protein